MPKVSLTQSLRAACLVQVGDTLPDAKLPDLDGKEHAVSSLFGRKLTVVCFWNAGKARHAKKASAKAPDAATEMLQDLAREIAQPLADKGVHVVAVNVGDTADSAAARGRGRRGVPQFARPEGGIVGPSGQGSAAAASVPG